jgi:hypothetical protein
MICDLWVMDVGRTERNEHSKITKHWAGIARPLAAPSITCMKAKSAHVHLLLSHYALRENGYEWRVVSSTCCHWISCERGKLGWSYLRATSWCVWRYLHGCQQCQKVGGTFWGRKHGHRRSAGLWSTKNCYNWVQQAKRRRTHQTRQNDVREIPAQLGVRHHAVREMVEILGYRKICFRWVPRLLTGTEVHKTAGNCPPIHPKVRIWPPQTTTCSGPWKITREVTTTRLTRQFSKPCEAGCEELERTSTAEACFKILQRWQKCIGRHGDFVETQ